MNKQLITFLSGIARECAMLCKQYTYILNTITGL